MEYNFKSAYIANAFWQFLLEENAIDFKFASIEKDTKFSFVTGFENMHLVYNVLLAMAKAFEAGYLAKESAT